MLHGIITSITEHWLLAIPAILIILVVVRFAGRWYYREVHNPSDFNVYKEEKSGWLKRIFG